MNHYDLMLNGAKTLARMTRNGIKVDIGHYEREQVVIQKEMDSQLRLIEKEYGGIWRKRHRIETNYTSPDQLADVIFNGLGRTSKQLTGTGKNSTSAENLQEHSDLPLVQYYLKYQKLQKLKSTYIKNILNEQVDGFLHPFFNLHTVVTYRSSSSNPNFQNMPIRDPYAGKVIRTGLVARPGHRLVEVDYSGAEVRVGACYHKDPTMIEYINDPKKDMHRDMAGEVYMTPVESVSKQMRQTAKGGFVFAQFYGSGYVQCAENLWDAAINLFDDNGVCCMDTLNMVGGISKLGPLDYEAKPKKGTFVRHMRDVVNSFWNDRFPDYQKWKEEVWGYYLKKCRIEFLTGFVIQDKIMKKNQVINTPVQGAAFHCLLWSIIVLQEYLDKYKMKAKLVGQIHDSIIADVPDDELEDFLVLIDWVMTRRIKKAYKWLIVPMEIEAEVSPVGGCWADKQEVAVPTN